MSILWNHNSEETHKGAVLGFETAVERIMSDVYADVRYAVVLEDGKLKKVAIGNGEFGASASATVDANAETLEAAHNAMVEQELAKLRSERATYVDQLVYQAITPMKGKTVTVVRGRKIPVGTTGEVFWMGDKGWGLNVGLRQADGTAVFVKASYCEVVNPDDYLDMDECLSSVINEGYARKLADKRLFTLTGYTVRQPQAIAA